MRILFVTAAYLPESIGGVELHVHALAREYARLGHEVVVFTRGADATRPEFAIERYRVDGVAVVRLNYRFSDCVDFAGIVRNASIRAAFDGELARQSFDVVHVHHLTCLSTDLIDAARARGLPVVMTLHDFWMGCPRGQRMTRELFLCEDVDVARCATCLPQMWSGWFGLGRDGPNVPEAERDRRDLEQLAQYHTWMRGLLGRVERLITPSRHSKLVFERYGIAPERIVVVENGLDDAPFRGITRTPSRRFRFGYVGSVLPTKGVHVLIDAFVKLADPATELHVWGEAGAWHEVTDYGAKLRAAAAGHERIAFHGRYGAHDLPRILAGLDALVVPSLWYEAFCLTLREGWLARLPVAASCIGALEEAVSDGVDGLLFPAGNADALRLVLHRLAHEPGLAARLADSRPRVRTVHENANDLLRNYADFAGGRR